MTKLNTEYKPYKDVFLCPFKETMQSQVAILILNLNFLKEIQKLQDLIIKASYYRLLNKGHIFIFKALGVWLGFFCYLSLALWFFFLLLLIAFYLRKFTPEIKIKSRNIVVTNLTTQFSVKATCVCFAIWVSI